MDIMKKQEKLRIEVGIEEPIEIPQVEVLVEKSKNQKYLEMGNKLWLKNWSDNL